MQPQIRKTEKLVRNAAKVGLRININQNNAKQQSNSRPSQTQRTRHIEEVAEFTYLAAKVTTNRNTEDEIKIRIKGSICCSGEHLEDENDQQENKDTHSREM